MGGNIANMMLFNALFAVYLSVCYNDGHNLNFRNFSEKKKSDVEDFFF